MSKRQNNKTRDKNKSNNRSGNNNTNSQKEMRSNESQTSAVDTSNSSKEESPSNDPSWYDVVPGISQAAASIPFGYAFGSDLPTSNRSIITALDGTDGWSTTAIEGESYSMPGICSLKLLPSLGGGGAGANKNKVLDLVSQNLYVNVRHATSGRKNYEDPDLFMTVVAIAELYSFIMYCQRLYAYAFMYSQKNWYLGRRMIEACGVNPDNVVENLATFRYNINRMVYVAQQYPVPANMSYFARKIFLYSGYYTESATGNIKDAVYQFIPAGFYKFAIINDVSGLDIEYTNYNNATVGDLLNTFDSLIANLLDNEDIGVISADVVKAFGNNLFTLPAIPAELSIVPSYDPYVLSQFKNADIIPWDPKLHVSITGTSTGSEVIYNGQVSQKNSNLINLIATGKTFTTSDTDALGWDTIAAINITETSTKLLDVDADQPDYGYVMESTRLKVARNPSQFHSKVTFTDDDGNAAACWTSYFTGTEICVGVSIGYFNNGIFSVYSPKNWVLEAVKVANSSAWWIIESTLLRCFPKFRFAPQLFIQEVEHNDDVITNYAVTAYMNNCENVTTLEFNTLTKIHEAALTSLLYIPGVTS